MPSSVIGCHLQRWRTKINTQWHHVSSQFRQWKRSYRDNTKYTAKWSGCFDSTLFPHLNNNGKKLHGNSLWKLFQHINWMKMETTTNTGTSLAHSSAKTPICTKGQWLYTRYPYVWPCTQWLHSPCVMKNWVRSSCNGYFCMIYSHHRSLNVNSYFSLPTSRSCWQFTYHTSDS